MAASLGSVNDGENPSISTLPRPSRPPEPTWEGVADKLLREKLLLTGLELYLELEERGRELPTSLKEFFSNPGNFEARCSSEAPSSSLPAPDCSNAFPRPQQQPPSQPCPAPAWVGA
ncbi:RAB11-binding protein RELCH-like, partial [Portunus trituberculatus]|uniref:RAB11-binding protein RELCH-like n=1 Tax=Portunus trituberculatus TaxID=210409 RepID=UPI001E1D062C